MPRIGYAYTLVGANAHTQLNTTGGNTVQTLTPEAQCTALLVSARTGNAYVTFDNSTPAATNGIEIVAGAQPVIVPLGYQAHGTHAVKCIGSVASTILNVVQLS